VISFFGFRRWVAALFSCKGQALRDLENVEKKFVDFANTLPADKLTWRQSPDSHSVAEIFLHVAGERYGILSPMGAECPVGFDGKSKLSASRLHHCCAFLHLVTHT
jgi:hypothetical protein